MTDTTTVKSKYEIVLIAVLAGFTPIILKYVSRDQQALVELFNWSYLWTGLIMSVLGYLACYLSGEMSRMKLFALAISAPALFSNMTGETQVAEAGPNASIAAANPVQAIRRYLGDDKLYSVSVFASRSFENANKLAIKINDKHPELQAHVADRKIDDEFYSVIVGSAQPREGAQKLADQSNALLVDSDPNNKKGFWLNQNSWLKLYTPNDCRASG